MDDHEQEPPRPTADSDHPDTEVGLPEQTGAPDAESSDADVESGDTHVEVSPDSDPAEGGDAHEARPDPVDETADTGVDDAAPMATGRSRRPRRRRSFWREVPILAALAVGLALLVKTFLVQAFYIPSGSMENTLQVGDRVLVNKAIYRVRDVRRGEVVVFDGSGSWTPEAQDDEPDGTLERVGDDLASAVGLTASGERDFVKRVIGLPGDRVACCDDQGRITVNGVPLDETYLYPGDKPSEVEFDVEVPEGRLWVMGDHRSDSRDSREFMGAPGGGTIPEDDVIGRAFLVVWPLDRLAGLDVPDTFDRPVLQSFATGGSVVGAAVLGPVAIARRRRSRRPPDRPAACPGR